LEKANLMDEMKRFGEYAVDLGYCTTKDVARAVDIQDDLVKRGFPRMLIGLVMVRYGVINNGQLLHILQMLEAQRVSAILSG
jgi:hypothetical protein